MPFQSKSETYGIILQGHATARKYYKSSQINFFFPQNSKFVF